MLTNAEIKEIRSLREKKFREASGLFVVEGEKMVGEALAAEGFRVERVIQIEDVGPERMGRICLSATPPPVMAVVRMPAKTAGGASMLPEGLCLALDGVRDPGNMGTILRTADWFGVRRVYMSADCVEVYNPKVVQASMGSLFRMECLNVDLPDLCAASVDAGLEVYGTFLDGEEFYGMQLSAEGLIVMGNEGSGISAPVAGKVSRRLRIPSFGGCRAESLNVAAATAVMLSEFRRRML